MNNTYSKTTHFRKQKIMVLTKDIGMPSDSRQVDLRKLGIDIENLPKETVKKIEAQLWDKSFLEPYKQIRNKAESLSSRGTKHFTGEIFTKSTVIEVAQELQNLRTEWDDTKEKHKHEYADLCEKRQREVLESAARAGCDLEVAEKLIQAISKSQGCWDTIASKLRFDFVVTPLVIDEDDFDAELKGLLSSTVQSLKEGVMSSMIKEVCERSSRIWVNLMERESKARSKKHQFRPNTRTVEAVRTMLAKLKDLGFLHEHIRTVYTAINGVMETLPSNVLTGSQYQTFRALISSVNDHQDVMDKLRDGVPLVTVIQQSSSIGQPSLKVDVDTGHNEGKASESMAGEILAELAKPEVAPKAAFQLF